MLSHKCFNISINNINRCINNIRILSITSSRLLASNSKDGNDKSKHIDEPPIDYEIVHLEDDQSIQIPVYSVNPNETLDIRKQRLIYQSRKRGMLENDLLLSTFASKYLKGMNETQINLYDKLINTPSNDWDIYYWATNTKPTPDEYSSEIMDLLKKHVQNENREKRVRMPALD